MASQVNIPKIPHAFFKWYCRGERYEEIHGDLEELFVDRVEAFGHAKARRLYLLDVIRCCQPYAWKKSKTQITTIIMFKNYYKTSFRGLMKNPLSSFINVFGLSMAIGTAIMVFAFTQWVHKVDQFHENRHEVFLTTIFLDRDGTTKQNGKTPRPLAEQLKQDFSQIKKVCRIEDGPMVVKHRDNVYHESVRYTDPEFLEMFTFPMKWGSATSLADLNSIILSEDAAIKYFGYQNPVGKELVMIFDGAASKSYEVTGVAEAFPDAHAIDFDFLINFKNLRVSDPDYDYDDWSAFVGATLIQLNKVSDLATIEASMGKYKKIQNQAHDDWAISSFTFEPIATLYERSGAIENTISSTYYSSNLKSSIILSILAIMMLALGCFNYINIAIVSAAKRLKEIGLRKVIGANRKMIVVQFLAENLLMTLIALLFGLGLATGVIIPWFEYMNDFSMDFQLLNINLWLFMLGVLLFTAFVSGIYPAFYISKFQVSTIFRGSVKFGKKNPLTKVFLGFQLILACILIVSAVMFTQNAKYIAARDWGYNPHGALYAEIPDYAAFEKLKASLNQSTHVAETSGSTHHLGKNQQRKVIHKVDQQYEVDQLAVDAGYFDVMQLRIKRGRTFIEDLESDKQAIIVNEVFVKQMGLVNAIGSEFKIDNTRYEIIGVVEDFHPYSFANELNPTIFTLATQDNYNYLAARVEKGGEKEAYQRLQKTWAALFPEIPFQGGYQEDVWGGYFDEVRMHGKFWTVVAFVVVILASLGLFGLVTLNVTGRIKEFSVKRVLGANLKHVAQSILKQYTLLFAIALVIGAPVSYFLIEMFFDSVYTYHVPINIVGVLVAIGTLTAVLIAIVATQVGKVAKSNPVDGLKVE